MASRATPGPGRNARSEAQGLLRRPDARPSCGIITHPRIPSDEGTCSLALCENLISQLPRPRPRPESAQNRLTTTLSKMPRSEPHQLLLDDAGSVSDAQQAWMSP